MRYAALCARARTQKKFHNFFHDLRLVLGFYRSQKGGKIPDLQAFKVAEIFLALLPHFASLTNMHIWFGKPSGPSYIANPLKALTWRLSVWGDSVVINKSSDRPDLAGAESHAISYNSFIPFSTFNVSDLSNKPITVTRLSQILQKTCYHSSYDFLQLLQKSYFR